ncbi:unnamed protein product, partial [Ectocarpus sp. 8 AP-2014]
MAGDLPAVEQPSWVSERLQEREAMLCVCVHVCTCVICPKCAARTFPVNPAARKITSYVPPPRATWPEFRTARTDPGGVGAREKTSRDRKEENRGRSRGKRCRRGMWAEGTR